MEDVFIVRPRISFSVRRSVRFFLAGGEEAVMIFEGPKGSYERGD